MFLRSVLIFTFLYVGSCFSQIDKNTIIGKINIEKKDNLFLLRAQVLNKSLLHINNLNYNLVAVKKGKSNNYSQNKQSGKFSIKPEEEKYIASLRINLNNKEELRAYLFIKYKNKLIHRDTLFITSTNKSRKVNNEANFFLKGIVIDEAITKIGKDFYDFFYQKYLLSSRNYPFVIKVKEKPTIGRSSVVSIEVEDTKVHEFFARPDEDYLKSNINIALQRLVVYSRNRKSILNKKF